MKPFNDELACMSLCAEAERHLKKQQNEREEQTRRRFKMF